MRQFARRQNSGIPMRFNQIALFALVILTGSWNLNPAAAQNDPVLAKVNGTEIHQSDLAIAEADIGESLPAEVAPDKRREVLLTYLINVNLLAQAAEKQKADQAPNFAQRIAFARKKVLVQSLMEQETKKAASDAAIQKFYDEKAKPQTEVHARHILVETEEQAKDVEAQLKKGADFTELAKKMSKDPGSDGGDLGYITKEQVVPEFGNVAFSLPKGKISDPVKTQFGWHIIKVEDTRERKPPPLDAVKDQIKAKLSQDATEAMMQKLRADAKIEMTGDAPSAAPAPGKKK
jgi:peptidyl-prolyl cis-trans isomerase C